MTRRLDYLQAMAPETPKPVRRTSSARSKSRVLDDALLAAFMRGFFGYGNLDAPTWFVGMEEGGGNTISEIHARLSAWDRRGRKPLEHLREFHLLIGVRQLMEAPVRLQKTWAQLIRVLFASRGSDPPNSADVRRYQAHALGHLDGETALLELLPLPSPSIGTWLYGDNSGLDVLESRSRYRDHVTPTRVGALRHLVEKHEPRQVIFYGSSPSYRRCWSKIAGTDLVAEEIEGRNAWFGSRNPSDCVVTLHPNARGVTNRYFTSLGDRLRVRG